MRTLIFIFILLSPVSIFAGQLLNSYLPHMNIAQDWKRISWGDQVRVAEEVAADAGLKNGSPVNACMDMAASDVRLQGLLFKTALHECVKVAQKNQ